ncbi:hypothetical protein D9615_009984 [Tricholomella constricta]|uniref:DUF6534 domain-containing protein n=1 Tax=Tricholomella constricta TaxID=117010 RepID=A0A8H5GQ67_9AGAR|nr:hypothetical protein D9615_009984 [Tricholomella constricta]
MDFASGSGGAIFSGAAISYVMYGVTCCQAIWYFKSYPRDADWLKCMVAFVVLLETLQCILMFIVLWYYMIQRGVGEDRDVFTRCSHWSVDTGPDDTHGAFLKFVLILVNKPYLGSFRKSAAWWSRGRYFSLIADFGQSAKYASSYFLRRMWKLSTKKRLAALAFIPLFAGWGITIAYLIDLYTYPCMGDPSNPYPLILSGTIVNTLTDFVIAVTMSMILHKRRPDTTRHTNSLKILRSLIIKSLLSGTLMCLSTIAVLVLFLAKPGDVYYVAAYFLLGKIYANTLLATLNSRKTLRWLPNATIELDIVSVPSRRAIHGIDAFEPPESPSAHTAMLRKPTTHLPTLHNYLEASRQILSVLLQIPPIDPSTSLRTAFLLRLTNDSLSSIVGYPASPNSLPEALDWLDDLDQAWLAVLQAQVWDPETGAGVDLFIDAADASTGMKSSPVSQTERTRLRSLLVGSSTVLEEWLESQMDREDDEDVEAMLERLGLQAEFDDLFSRTLDYLGALGGVVVEPV